MRSLSTVSFVLENVALPLFLIGGMGAIANSAFSRHEAVLPHNLLQRPAALNLRPVAVPRLSSLPGPEVGRDLGDSRYFSPFAGAFLSWGHVEGHHRAAEAAGQRGERGASDFPWGHRIAGKCPLIIRAPVCDTAS